MRGYVFTLTTFLIFLGIITYFNAYVMAAKDRAELINEQVASERIWHSWRSAASGLIGTMNISVTKWAPDVDEINDTLPASRDVKLLLEEWQNFVRIHFNDSSLSARFEDDAGNEVSLRDAVSKISIMPMGINYTWPSWAKGESNIKADGNSFHFIERINTFVLVKPNITEDLQNLKYTPEKNCNQNTEHCLNFTLTFTDGNQTWSYFNTFDADDESQVTINLQGANWVRVTVGKLPNLLNVYMQNSNASTSTRIDLNTTEFYNSFLARLSVRTPFGQKVAPVSGLSVWTSQR